MRSEWSAEDHNDWSVHCAVSSLVRHGADTVVRLTEEIALMQRDIRRLREEIAELKAGKP